MYHYTRDKEQIQYFYNQRGKVIGRLVGKTLQKKVKGSVHQLRKPPSWAWDSAVIKEAEGMGAKDTEITDSETETKYKASLIDFHIHGIPINRGYGEQIALPIAYWTTDEGDNPQIRLF